MSIMHSPPGPYTVIDGRRYLYFGGTGYLGLQGHPQVIRAACEAAERYGIGSATSRAGCGDTPPVLQVEQRVAELFATEEALYFVSGYLGNGILCQVFRDCFDAVFADRLAHYCVIEGAQLAGRPIHRFEHLDPDDLARQLKERLPPGGRPLVASDGVFPSRGEIAPAAVYREVLAEYPGSLLLLDDAHALGVLGEHGRGTFEHAGLLKHGLNTGGQPAAGPAQLVCGTLSKAVGGYGGAIPGSRSFIDRLKTTSHCFRGASAPPVPIAAATAEALDLVIHRPEIRRQLWANVAAVRTGLRALGLAVDDSPVPIVSLALGEADNMRRIHAALAQREIYVPYRSAYPGLGQEGSLRLAVFANHTPDMFDRLLEELQKVL